MTDFLLELRSEEIPARMQDKARDDLARLFAAELERFGLFPSKLVTYATPRRLALIAYDLPPGTMPTHEEIKGPPADAPETAIDGFIRKAGVGRDSLITKRDAKGRETYFALIHKPARSMAEILAEAIPAIIRAFPWPKSQRWGTASRSTESLRWVRPLQGIVALLGDDVVACEIDGIVSGSATMGHRFHHSGPVTIGNAADYAMKLRAAHVIVDQEERRSIIRAGAEKAAADAGLVLVPDEGLVNENSGLTEWPVPMLGRFDPAFLAVPEEVIQLTARVNQKYFICRDAGGKLANAFVCTANIVARDGGTSIVAGNEKVLAARLSDAKFFWEQDLKIPLEEQAKKLSQIVFHEKLGTVADKVERVAKLARWLVEEGTIPLPEGEEGAQGESLGKVRAIDNDPHPSATASLPPSPEGRGILADLAERAARLCKADLVTGMVGEFPELQGVMGGYYARAQGEPDEVADAIRDHYKPVGQGDDVPMAPVTVAVSLADKLDTFVAFFGCNEMPTGSKDPYALRRASLGFLALIQANDIRLPIGKLWAGYWEIYKSIAVGNNLHPIRLERRIVDGDDNLHCQAFKIDSLEGYEGPFDAEIHVMGPLELVVGTAEWRLEDALSRSAYRIIDPVVFPENLISFMTDRLKVQQREAGVRHDLIDAVFALGGEDDLVRLLARVKALQAFVGTEDGKNLLAGYKRAANILKQAGSPADAGVQSPVGGADGLRLSPENRAAEEAALLTALDAAEPKATAAIAAEDFEGAMLALASLRAPIDAFFEGVMVNDPDPAKRAFRMGLLARFRDAVHAVADFGKIEG